MSLPLDERPEVPLDARDRADLVVVGAGPCGLAAAVSAMRAGMSSLVFDAGCVASTITQYPTYVSFFSTAEKLGIGGLPFVTADAKPTRREGLAYYRAAVRHFGIAVRQYEAVSAIEAVQDPDAPPRERRAKPRLGEPLAARLLVRTRTRGGAERVIRAHAVVVATGYFGSPNRLRVPGEELPHVRHVYREGHEAFQQDAVVVGGGNSAAEAALDLYRSGARVTLVHFGPTFDKRIKPWILPDLQNRMKEGAITAEWNSRVRAIGPDEVVIGPEAGTAGEERRLRAQHVYVMTGFAPNLALLEQTGVPIDPATGVPAHDPESLETPVQGLFVAGVVVAGFDANKVFIENGRFHGDQIVARITGRPVPPPPKLSAELDT
ncbi:MAG: YpdA family putative bacillithiol disulfide reductase [Gemmatimonadaceae bacterium]